MTTTGYAGAKQRTEAVATLLGDMATLIGERRDEEVALEAGGALVPGLGLESEAATLGARAEDIRRGIFKILVLGEFKNGKSTLLNAMLGHRTLAARATPTTAVVTVLVYGDSQDVALFENGSDTPRVVSWDAFMEEFTLTTQDIETIEHQDYLDRFQDVDYAQMECLHPFCAQGVRLIDSPGLGEHVSRTRVTTDYVQQAHAIIFVLNATRIISQDERTFIERVLGQGPLNHVFFVVNYINRVAESGPEDVREVKAWVRQTLAPHFLDDQDEFDEAFYRSRVFFVNALAGLRARSQDPIDGELLLDSGVPELERSLERFLTGGGRIAAALESTVQVLDSVVALARRRVFQQKAALDRPLEELRAQQADVERRLRGLERRKSEIERTVLLFGDAISLKVFADLRDALRRMKERWNDEAPSLLELDEVSLGNVLKSFASQQAKQEIAEVMEREVRRYLRVKLGDWSAQIPQVIEEDVARMMAEVEAEVDSFQLELAEIDRLFAGGQPAEVIDTDQRRGRKTVQLLLTVLSGAYMDVNQLTGIVMGRGDWVGFFARDLQQLLLTIVVFTLFTGPVAWLVLLAVEGVLVVRHHEKFKERLIQNLGPRLFEGLEGALEAKQADVLETVKGQFAQFAQRLTSALQHQIDVTRAEQERIIRQKQDSGFVAEQEKQRLDGVEAKLLALFDQVSMVAAGEGMDAP
jgi:GTPase Era involved in 16S rRNA processing